MSKTIIIIKKIIPIFFGEWLHNVRVRKNEVDLEKSRNVKSFQVKKSKKKVIKVKHRVQAQ